MHGFVKIDVSLNVLIKELCSQSSNGHGAGVLLYNYIHVLLQIEKKCLKV